MGTGNPQRGLPYHLPLWLKVWIDFRQWRDDGTLDRLHDHLRDQVRQQTGRHPHSSAVILDSQSVKTTEKGARGSDSGKQGAGRKPHLVVDTLGLIYGLVIHPANLQDRDGARLVLTPLMGRMPRLRGIWADAGYGGKLVDWVQVQTSWDLEVVAKAPGATTFTVLPHSWILERTFAWLGKYRRLSKDYEHLVSSSVAMIRLAMIRLMTKRLARAR